MRLAQDGGRRRPRDFASPRKAEQAYARDLRKLARHIGEIIRGFPAGDPDALPQIQAMLERYAEIITPWAEAVAGRMLEDVAKRDEKEWAGYAREMGLALRREIRDAPTGALMRERLAAQVTLIRSLPLEAAERVHHLTIEGIADSTRASEIAAEIMRSGDVAASRAALIARTETSRTATMLLQARAEHIGSEMFIWRTAGDSDVRPSHKKLNGKAFRWDDPPECDPGHRALPGAIWNCRCVAIPIIPDAVR